MNETYAFLRNSLEQPFFLYLALTIPHANNEAGAAGMEVPDLGTYADRDWPAPQKAHAAMISRMDRDLGRLFALLRELELDRKTVVFFTSDNGPHREGGNDPDFADSNGPLRGIKRSLHEGGIRVPLIVRWPGHVREGTVSSWVGSFQDVLPTVAEMAGAPIPATTDGISFLPTLLGRSTQPDHASLYWAFYEAGGGRALRAGDWKLIEQPIGSAPRLYNLQEDLGEQRDLAAQESERVDRLRQMMDESYQPSPRWEFPSDAR
jgi:arylsulfatase A-like enzyme